MSTVLSRLLQPTWLAVSLVLLSLLAALAVWMWAGAINDTQQLVGPFRWVLPEQLA